MINCHRFSLGIGVPGIVSTLCVGESCGAELVSAPGLLTRYANPHGSLLRSNGMTTQIPVSSGKWFAIVDDDDVDRLSQFTWSASYISGRPEQRYAQTKTGTGGHMIKMHRLIMGVTNKSLKVDHVNGNPLDNRKENLRVCKQGENMRNYRRASGSVGTRGVCKTAKGKFRARIRLNMVGYEIGTFDTLHDASVAYAFASQVFHGEFGSLPGHEAFMADVARRLPDDEDVSMLENIQTDLHVQQKAVA